MGIQELFFAHLLLDVGHNCVEPISWVFMEGEHISNYINLKKESGKVEGED